MKKTKNPRSPGTSILVSFPTPEDKDRVAEAAKKDSRSINNFIVKAALEAVKKLSGN